MKGGDGSNTLKKSQQMAWLSPFLGSCQAARDRLVAEQPFQTPGVRRVPAA